MFCHPRLPSIFYLFLCFLQRQVRPTFYLNFNSLSLLRESSMVSLLRVSQLRKFVSLKVVWCLYVIFNDLMAECTQ